ncbi:hypothetical protein [Bauldia sp.]|uniref:hypothetical protein n=1 Tax=Bauldia sp. TaxID=2575872 RepID=UPI003BA8B1EB
MAEHAIYAYAWDLAEAGVGSATADFRDRGLNTVTMAAAYHAGKFLRPHGQTGKVYFPEDGTVYFRTDAARYGEIKPAENSLLAETDVLASLCDDTDLDSNAWLVLMHNTRIGMAYPHVTVANAFGDRYVYSLCPAAPAAHEYALALCTDVTESYGVRRIVLETPGFLPFVHGYHHEFALARQNRWLNDLLGLCFCDNCRDGAYDDGIDAEALRDRVRTAIESYLVSDIDFTDDMADAFWLADIVADPDLGRFLRWRRGIVTALVAEIRAAVRSDIEVSVIPSVARPTGGAWYEGTDLAALTSVADSIDACFYEPSVDRIRGDLFDVTRRTGGTDKLRGILRPSHPDLDSRGAVIDAVAALSEAGVTDLAFYNYGHLRPASLDWIGDALAALESQP